MLHLLACLWTFNIMTWKCTVLDGDAQFSVSFEPVHGSLVGVQVVS